MNIKLIIVKISLGTKDFLLKKLILPAIISEKSNEERRQLYLSDLRGADTADRHKYIRAAFPHTPDVVRTQRVELGQLKKNKNI